MLAIIIFIALITSVCFFVTLIKLYRYLFRRKFDINLNADIIAILIVALVFWSVIFPIIFMHLLHFYISAAYLITDILIWCIKKYREKREIKEHIKSINEKRS